LYQQGDNSICNNEITSNGCTLHEKYGITKAPLKLRPYGAIQMCLLLLLLLLSFLARQHKACRRLKIKQEMTATTTTTTTTV